MGRYTWSTTIVMLVMGSLGYFCHKHIVRTQQQRRLSRNAIISLMNKLQVGDTAEDVESAVRLHRAARLQLVKNSRDAWTVTTPLEFGATNWLLYIDFRNQRVVRLRIRTEDSIDFKPPEAPADKCEP